MKNRLPILFIVGMIYAFPALLSAQTYNVYFGDIHSHSWYSDGNTDQNPATFTLPVARSITYAKSSPNMNFLGISDHNHCCLTSGFPMTLNLWRSGHREADSVNQDGVFVGLYGQEWGTTADGGGHSLIYGTDKLYGWDAGTYDVLVPKNNFSVLVDSVKKYGGFLYFAHPATDQFGNIFTSAYNATWDSVVMGIAIKNGPSTSTNTSETDPSSTDYTTRYHDLLKIGYHVAPCANQDNHKTNFGRSNQQRTAVLATSLTKANIIDGLRNRRTYATEDHNLQLRFESGTHQMGEIFTTTSPVALRVKVVDAGESISSIVIRYGVPGSGVAPTTLTSVASRDSLVISHPQTNGTTYYYYAYVLESDGSEAWSAPIWITTSSTPPPGAFAMQSPSSGASGVALSGSLTWDASANATGYDVYLGASNPPTTMVSSNQAGTSYGYSGLTSGSTYFWKVVARNSTSTVEATGSPRSFTAVVITPGAFALLTPTNGQTGRPLSGSLTWEASVDALVYDVYFGTANSPTTIVSANQAGLSYAYGGLTNNTQYFWKVIAKNGGQSTTSTAAPWSFTTVLNAPGSFAHLAPANGALHQPLSGSLSWQTSASATGYDVYFGATDPPSLASANQPGTTFAYGPLPQNAVRYWKIVARNATDTTIATGSPWIFTTVDPPSAFVLLSPDSGSVGRPLTGTLSWDTSGGASSYDVFVDVVDPPGVKVDSNLAGTSYFYQSYQPSTTFYWKVIARNVDGEITSSNSPWSFTTVNVPMAPLELSLSDVGTTNLELNWKDTATNEDGYHIYRSQLADGPFDQVADLPSDAIVFNDSGLSINERYYYLVVPYNGSGEGLPGQINVSTLAAVPGAPSLTVENFALHLVVDPGVNPVSTEFAVAIEFDSTVAYAQPNGSVLPGLAWGTISEWSGGAGVTLVGIGCTEYTVSVQARNKDNVVTSSSAPAIESLVCVSVSSDIESGWNLVSLPVQLPDQSKSTVFPTSTSQAFSYVGGYQQMDTLQGGVGYWIKFNGSENVIMNGQPVGLDTIELVGGWNIIGSISSPVGISAIVEEPASLVSSSYFGYNGSYAVTDSIYPMQAYWVKANQAGVLIFSPSAQIPSSAARSRQSEEMESEYGVLSFSDAEGHSRVLRLRDGALTSRQLLETELPPLAPQGSFDVRFTSQRSMESVNSGAKPATPISVEIQSQSGPVDLSWDLSATKDLHLSITYGSTTVPLAGTGSLRIPDGVTTAILNRSAAAGPNLPTAFALQQNYPNPFNPSTEIRFALPVRSMVRMTVYNLLGVPVATLLDGELEAGFHSTTWHPSVSSGMYFYKMEAVSSSNPSSSYQRIARMLYLK